MNNSETMNNVTIYDNGAAFCVCVNGMIVKACNCLGDAWRHIQWMYEIASQRFTVSEKHIDVRVWLGGMVRAGYLD